MDTHINVTLTFSHKFDLHLLELNTQTIYSCKEEYFCINFQKTKWILVH